MLLWVTEVHYRSYPEAWTSTPIIQSQRSLLVVLSIPFPSQCLKGPDTTQHWEKGAFIKCA